MADSCAQYVSTDDLKAAKESILHIEHVATSKDANGNPALVVTDPIRGVGYTNSTLDGLEESYKEAIRNLGWNTVGTFQAGATLDQLNDIIQDTSTLTWYRWDGALPKNVPASSTPSGTGGITEGAWQIVDVSDVLRRDLASSDPGKGVSLVNGAATTESVTALSDSFTADQFQNYNRAAEYAKLLQDSGGSAPFSIDCFGDSTMWGATSNNVGVQDPNNPPVVLKNTIAGLYGSVLTVNNRGISGTTMAQMLAGTDGSGSTFESKISTTAASVIYCNHAINDSQLNNNIHQYRLNVLEFVRICRKYGKVPVLVTPNINPYAVGGAIITEAKSKRLEKYVDVMRKCAAAVDCDLVDNYYYFTKTTRMVSPQTLVPDGAHPSTLAYAMSGRNLAIPLVSARVLSKAYDKAGLANTTYYDNISTSRNYFESGGPFDRFNGGLTGTRTSASTGVNLALILDNPTDDTVLVMYGPQWSFGTTSVLTYSGSSAASEFGGTINQNVFLSPLLWEGVYIPERCAMYAGLHVSGIIASTSFGESGADFGICGFGLLPRSTVMASLSGPTQIREYPVIAARATVELNLNLFAMGAVLVMSDCANSTAQLTINWAGNGAALTVVVGSSEFTIAAAVNTGAYYTKIKFNQDKTIAITVGNATITVPASSTAFPNMYISTPSVLHSIRYAV